MRPKQIRIQTSAQTGQVKTVTVSPEQTVGELMADLGYQGMPLTVDDRQLDIECNFMGRPGEIDVIGIEPPETEPFRLGLAE